MTIVHITYHDETNIGSCPIGQTGGFENADGNGEIHCFRIFDGVSVMLMQMEMGSYTEIRTQVGVLEVNFCINGRFETSFSMRMFKTIYLSGEAGNHARFVMKKDVNHIVYSIKSLQSAFVALLLDRTNLSNEPRRERSSDQPVAFLPQIAPTFCFQRFPDRILCAGHVKKCFHVPIQCAHFVHRVHGMVGRTDFP